ncbi:MAG TPA: cupin domain-containing protein [Terriglobales bacterium]|jgi:quercetin dioxygenase-like cupin family protein|nr:cupin domain-containing protein [Terriglobales bacterium]
MKRLMFAIFVGAVITLTLAETNKKEIVGITPQQVRWFTPSYYTDGRERAQLFGDSTQGGVWVDRARIPAGKRVRAHTHPQDEVITVIEGTWYLGEGTKSNPTDLHAYPAGSFLVIPAGVPHFVETRESAVIVQLSGNGKFETTYVEK